VTPESRPAFRIASATEEDVPLILRLIKGLAEYEKLASDVKATEEHLRKTLFGKTPAAEVIIGYEGEEPVGFALFFQNYSTFMGRPGLYLEDLFVVPERRGRGYGRRLLQHLARIAVDRNYARVEWAVLDWNEPAIRFYKSLGARSMDDWTLFRLTGDSLRTLAEE
jgi:GNAT superfamily N-acetyltransferase